MPSISRAPLSLVTGPIRRAASDAELARALGASEDWAVAEAWHRFAPMVLMTAERAIGSTSEAEDLAQEVFCRVFRTVKTLREPRAKAMASPDKAGIDLKYRRNQLFPSLNFVASYGRKGASTDQVFPPQTPSASFPVARDQIEDGDSPNDMLGVVFSVPLTLSAERANYRASKNLKAQAELRVKQLEEQVMREISDSVHTVQSRFERVERSRRARELSEAALEAEEQKLTGGKSTLFFVLQLQSDLATSRSAEIRAKADYNRAVSQLRFAEASLLEHGQLAIEIK